MLFRSKKNVFKSIHRNPLFWVSMGVILILQVALIEIAHDEVVILTSEMHDPCAQESPTHTRRKQEHLAEGTGVEPAKHPPKVKSEIFLQL